jgi:hypothetical protein
MATKPYSPFSAGDTRPSVLRLVLRKGTTKSPRRVVDHVRAGMTASTARPRLAYVCVPLAIVASCVIAAILVLPLVACWWWYAPDESGWELLAVAGRGFVGLEWTLLESISLPSTPLTCCKSALSGCTRL